MRSLIVLLTVLMIACASTHGKSYTTNSPLSPESAFDCVHRAILELTLGYYITDGNRPAGFIRATASVSTAVYLSGDLFYDRLTVSIIANNGDTTLKITSTEKKSATAILDACSAS